MCVAKLNSVFYGHEVCTVDSIIVGVICHLGVYAQVEGRIFVRAFGIGMSIYSSPYQRSVLG
jgi:hypothetical protein